MLQIALAACLAPTCAAANPTENTYQLRIEKVKRVQAVLTMKIESPNLNATEWNVYLPVAPQLTSQRDVQTRVSPDGQKLIDFSPLRRSLLESTIKLKKDKTAKEATLRIIYKATLYSRKLEKTSNSKESVAAVRSSPKTLQQNLASFGSINYRSYVFQKWLMQNRLRPKEAESEIDFAKRLFSHIHSKYSYFYDKKLNRQAWYVCQTDKSDCAGLSVLFAAALRANKIPARVLYGRWARSSNESDKVSGVAYTQSHVVAEFYASGVGWVPVDLSSAILDKKSKTGLKYFGNAGGNFFTQHLDPELGVKTRHFGHRIVHSLQQPAYMISGGGSMQDAKATIDWDVRTIQ